MGPASRFEVGQRDAFALALWELGHYRRRRGVPPDQEKAPTSGRIGRAWSRNPRPGDYVRVWRSRELERSGKLGCTDTLSTELTGSTTPAAVILFVACRLRRRWSELGGWYAAQMADTRLHPLDCAFWN